MSVICAYNNEKILNDYLLKELKNQTINYELILIDNTQGQFKSAAEALNYGGRRANGKYLMFIHQDVDLSSSTWLEETEKILDSISDLGAAGVVGIDNNGKWKGNIKQGELPVTIAKCENIKQPEKVQTLDECLLIIPKSVFNILKFDEKTCDGWHLYGTDYCLDIIKLNLKAYVIPMSIHHKSIGAKRINTLQIIMSLGWLPKEYYQILKRILIKHKSQVKIIYTTGGTFYTLYPLILQRIKSVIISVLSALLKKLSNPM